RVLDETSAQVWVAWTSVVGSHIVNELAGGTSFTEWISSARELMGGPQILLRGYTFGLGSNGSLGGCCLLNQHVPTVSNKFAYTSGNHTVKAGGEYLHPNAQVVYDGNTIGTLDARGGPFPANITAILPSNDPSTWNLAALSPISVQYQIWTGFYDQHNSQPNVSSWLQYDWKASSRVTLNLGLRHDLFYNGLANDFELLPLRTKAPQDWWNFGPRVGFAYAFDGDRTVIRGGTGKYFAAVRDQGTHHTRSNDQMVPVVFPNDGRPNFAADPFNLLGGGHI